MGVFYRREVDRHSPDNLQFCHFFKKGTKIEGSLAGSSNLQFEICTFACMRPDSIFRFGKCCQTEIDVTFKLKD